MSERPAMAGDGEAVSRRGRVSSVSAEGIDIAWLDTRCQGCVGCGGRCSLFAKAAGEIERLPLESTGIHPGMDVEVLVPAPRLRRGATSAYGLALAALVLGALAGHGLGDAIGNADLGALIGLSAGTFLAGRMTKRFAAAPRLDLRAGTSDEPATDLHRP